jgi:ATP-dependent DNA helicase RecG
MKIKDLHNLIALGEGFTVEFKKSGTSNIGRELCAFANATGGTILIGVTDNGEITGVSEHNKLKSIVQSIAHSIEPPLIVDIESIENILAASVPQQKSKPYSFAGKFYLREGASSQQLGRDEIRKFFFQEGLIHFDEMNCDRFVLDTHLTEDVFHLFVKRAKIPPELTPIQALENLHLVRNRMMTNAGAWLLSEDILNVSNSAHISCALFQGISKVHILDRKNFSRDLYSNFQDVISYLQSKLNTEFIITGTGRDERLELPVDALREALVNALAHRDYRSTANVQVYIFQDRVEIISPGGLPAGMKKEDLGKKSIPRNPLLFSMLYRMDLVEQIGSGIRRIMQLCHDYGVKIPQVVVEDNWVTVIFERDQGKPPSFENSVTGQVTGQVTGEIKKLVQVCTGELSRKELQLKLQLKHRDNFNDKYLKPALEEGFIEMTIPEKPRSSKQKYRLTIKGKSILRGLKS